jgi:PKHD-type hydroxylase
MNLKEYVWIFPSAINSKTCDEIVEYGLQKTLEVARTGDGKNNDTPENSSKKRKSEVTWLDDRWLYDLIQPYVSEANVEAGWNFQWDYSEKIQFTKYGNNQHYGWHTDSFAEKYEDGKDKNFTGKIRKLSCTVNLSDPKSYEGGDFEIDLRNSVDYELTPSSILRLNTGKPKGSIIVFPSFVWHRVLPVTKGVRYSLVCWNIGWPFV